MADSITISKTTIELSADDADTVRGILHALELIRAQSGHGSIHINIVDRQVSEIDMESRVRPKIAAPWRPKNRTPIP